MNKRVAVLLLPLVLLVLPLLVIAEPGGLDVPYVPTPEEVVEEMLRLAEVDRADLVYDLGCGDGRIVITAAKERGARGIGVDLDPERIRESEQRARQANVTDRVRFLQQDLFEIEMREASVVTLYLLPDINLRLRPKLLRELKPGSRVVSHDFDMGEWKPDQVSRMTGHTVYFWVVPANATGHWEWVRTGPLGEERCRLDLRQSFQTATGTLMEGAVRMPVREARIVGDRLRFTAERPEGGSVVPVTYEGRIRGHLLQGARRSANPAEQRWQAEREAATMVPLDGN